MEPSISCDAFDYVPALDDADDLCTTYQKLCEPYDDLVPILVPSCMRYRALALTSAMILHVSSSREVGADFHSCSRAVAALQGSDDKSEYGSVAQVGNIARHHGSLSAPDDDFRNISKCKRQYNAFLKSRRGKTSTDAECEATPAHRGLLRRWGRKRFIDFSVIDDFLLVPARRISSDPGCCYGNSLLEELNVFDNDSGNMYNNNGAENHFRDDVTEYEWSAYAEPVYNDAAFNTDEIATVWCPLFEDHTAIIAGVEAHANCKVDQAQEHRTLPMTYWRLLYDKFYSTDFYDIYTPSESCSFHSDAEGDWHDENTYFTQADLEYDNGSDRRAIVLYIRKACYNAAFFNYGWRNVLDEWNALPEIEDTWGEELNAWGSDNICEEPCFEATLVNCPIFGDVVPVRVREQRRKLTALYVRSAIYETVVDKKLPERIRTCTGSTCAPEDENTLSADEGDDGVLPADNEGDDVQCTLNSASGKSVSTSRWTRARSDVCDAVSDTELVKQGFERWLSPKLFVEVKEGFDTNRKAFQVVHDILLCLSKTRDYRLLQDVRWLQQELSSIAYGLGELNDEAAASREMSKVLLARQRIDLISQNAVELYRNDYSSHFP